MGKECKATKGLIPGAKQSQNADSVPVLESFLLSAAMTWSTLIKSSTIPNELFNETNQSYTLTSEKVK